MESVPSATSPEPPQQAADEPIVLADTPTQIPEVQLPAPDADASPAQEISAAQIDRASLSGLFSFNIEEYITGEEVSSSQSEPTVTADVKEKLAIVLEHLNKDVFTLMDDAEPIRAIFKQIKGQLTPDLESALTPASFIESQQFQVREAQRRIADRLTQQDVINQISTDRLKARDLKTKVDELEALPSQINGEINQLESKERQLLQELEQVRQDITSAKHRLEKHPEIISQEKEKLATLVRQTLHRHKSIKDIPSSDEEDRRIIDNVEQIRLRAVKAIQGIL